MTGPALPDRQAGGAWRAGGLPFSLEGKRALVIGAGSPAGSAVARSLAEAGANVAVAATRNEGAEVMATRRTRRAVEALGRRSAEYAFDLALGQNVHVSTKQVKKDLGGLDAVVVVPTLPDPAPSSRVTDADWNRWLGYTLSGAFYAFRSAARELAGSGGGALLAVVPVHAERGLAQQAVACAAMHGIVGLVRAFAIEHAAAAVRANGLGYGWLDADPAAGSNDPSNPLARYIPARRLGEAADLGPVAAYLCSDAADFVTGQVFWVDGAVRDHL